MGYLIRIHAGSNGDALGIIHVSVVGPGAHEGLAVGSDPGSQHGREPRQCSPVAALQEKADAEAQVFVFAKALNGPPMPLAAARHQVKDLPLEVTLDDASAMTPEMKLSNYAEIKVGARISLSGNAVAQSGDLAGEVSPVVVAAGELIEVVIDSVVP